MASNIGRRNLLKAGAALAPAMAAPVDAAEPRAEGPAHQTGTPLFSGVEANPLEVKIVTITTVSPDMAASAKFYRDTLGYTLAEEGTLAASASTAPGVGKAGRRYAIYHVPNTKRGASVRVLEAPPGAGPIRPRPGARTWDPGLLVMECGTGDPAESYFRLAAAKTPVISPPRYYPFRGQGRPLDPMSYAPFGPGGEQMFITANISEERPDWTEPNLHTAPGSVSIVSLDQRPVDEFYRKALGMRRSTQLVCQSRNCNELIGAPREANYLWGNVGTGVNIEVWEFRVAEATMYPCALDKTGLAMFTVRVNDLDKARAMCKSAGIRPVGEGALPIIGNRRPEGFTLRGMVGELIEVIRA